MTSTTNATSTTTASCAKPSNSSPKTSGNLRHRPRCNRPLHLCQQQLPQNSITNRLHQLFLQKQQQALQDGDTTNYYLLKVCAVKNLNDFTPNGLKKPMPPTGVSSTTSRTVPSCASSCTFTFRTVPSSVTKISYGDKCFLSKYDGLCFYGDLSYKAAGDYKAMLLVGKIGRQYHIIHVYLRRGSRAKCAAWLYDLYEDLKLERFNISYVIEGLFAMDEFVNDFDTEGDERGYHIPVTADKRGKADKYDRVESTAGFFERHNVIFNILMQQNPDFITLVDQFLAFERGSQANDDGPDAWHGAQARLNKITFVDKFQPRTVSRAERRSKSKNNY